MPYSRNVMNVDAETTKCYELIYKLIKASTFHNILLHYVNYKLYLYFITFQYLVYPNERLWSNKEFSFQSLQSQKTLV